MRVKTVYKCPLWDLSCTSRTAKNCHLLDLQRPVLSLPNHQHTTEHVVMKQYITNRTLKLIIIHNTAV